MKNFLKLCSLVGLVPRDKGIGFFIVAQNYVIFSLVPKNGIATLLQAEKEAHEIVSKARKYRQDKLKQAKTDAAKEIDSYKIQKDKELKEFEQKNAGGVGELEKKAEAGVQGELAEIKKIAEKKKDDVVKILIETVIKPSAEVHINAL